MMVWLHQCWKNHLMTGQSMLPIMLTISFFLALRQTNSSTEGAEEQLLCPSDQLANWKLEWDFSSFNALSSSWENGFCMDPVQFCHHCHQIDPLRFNTQKESWNIRCLTIVLFAWNLELQRIFSALFLCAVCRLYRVRHWALFQHSAWFLVCHWGSKMLTIGKLLQWRGCSRVIELYATSNLYAKNVARSDVPSWLPKTAALTALCLG